MSANENAAAAILARINSGKPLSPEGSAASSDASGEGMQQSSQPDPVQSEQTGDAGDRATIKTTQAEFDAAVARAVAVHMASLAGTQQGAAAAQQQAQVSGDAPWLTAASALNLQAAVVNSAPILQPGEGQEFFHTIPGSKFHYTVAPGVLEELVFIGGRVITNDLRAIRALNEVANRPGSFITTDPEVAKRMKIVSGEAAEDQRFIAHRSHDRMVKAGERTY